MDHDVGVDVEACDRKDAGWEAAARFFALEEVAALHETAATERIETFFRLWTLKESYTKAIGEGLNCALQSFSFALDPIAINLPRDSADDSRNWQFFELRPSGHFLAVALNRPADQPITVVTRTVRPQDL